jgi:hypothetical protein
MALLHRPVSTPTAWMGSLAFFCLSLYIQQRNQIGLTTDVVPSPDAVNQSINQLTLVNHSVPLVQPC